MVLIPKRLLKNEEEDSEFSNYEQETYIDNYSDINNEEEIEISQEERNFRRDERGFCFEKNKWRFTEQRKMDLEWEKDPYSMLNEYSI